MSPPRNSSQHHKLDPVAYELEQLPKYLMMPPDISPEEAAARRQAAVDMFQALGPRDALEANLASMLIATRYTAEYMRCVAAKCHPSDPGFRRVHREAASAAHLADQLLRDLRQWQRRSREVPHILEVSPEESLHVADAVLRKSRPQRPKLKLVVNRDTVRPVFGTQD